MSAPPYTPERGDLVFIDFNPQSGREQTGRRPALVLSPANYNAKVGLMLACPVTNQVKGYPFEVSLPAESQITGVILSDHVKSLDWRARKASFAETVDAAVVEEVLAKLGTLLG